MRFERVKGLVVGFGGIGRHMLKVLHEKPWYETVGVVDVRDEALRQAGEEEDLPAENLYKDLSQALKSSGANAAFINTPSELHFAQTKAALEAGVSPMVAKPITNCFEDAVTLVDLAKEKNVPLAVGQQIRFNRHYQAVKRFLESGRLGKIESLQFQNSKLRPDPLNLGKMSQPALYETSCHHFDSILSWFPEAKPTRIYCEGFRPSWSQYAGPCMVNAVIRFEPGLHVLYHGGFSSQAPFYEVRLEGTKGALRCHGLHMSNDQMEYAFAERGGSFERIDLDDGRKGENPWIPFFDRWYDFLQGGRDESFSGQRNLDVFALLSAAIESVEQGKAIQVHGSKRFERAFGE